MIPKEKVLLLNAINDIVNYNHKNVSSVNNLILKNIFEFFNIIEIFKIDKKDIVKYMKKDSKYQDKLNAFINEIDKDEYDKNQDIIKTLVGNNKTKSLAVKEAQNELFEFLGNIKGYGISFLGNDKYQSIKTEANLFEKIDIASMSSDYSIDVIRDIFSSDGALEWSVDGKNRLESAKLLEPLYNCSNFISLTKREFNKHPNFAINIGKKVVSAINQITQWSIRTVNESGGSSINLAQQKKLLKICSDAIINHKIPIIANTIYKSEDYDGDIEADTSNGYRMPKPEKFKAVNENLDMFIKSIKKQIVTTPIKINKVKK